jgi:hypothetical protein
MRNCLWCTLLLAFLGCSADSGQATFAPADAQPDLTEAKDAVAEDVSQVPDASGKDADASPQQDALGDPAEEPDVADVSFSYDAQESEKDVCANVVVEAKLPTLAIYILLDRSGSMTFANKWQTAIDGISQFVQDSDAAGMKVALQYFPLGPEDAGESCDGLQYATPAVPMGALPAHAAAMLASLNAALPEGTTTPTEGALRGIAQFGAAYGSVPPGSAERVIGLLMTDGMPAGPCDNTTAGLEAIAAASFGGTPSVPLYVLGMSGADFNVLSAIAAAGGTAAAYNVTSGGAAAFLIALKAIQGKAIGCEFSIPETDAGLIDPGQVQVLFTPTGGTTQKLGRQTGGGTCGLGWYFDDNTAPTKIVLCPSTCKLIQGDASGKVEVNLGCLGS